ncbi:PREDICTED: thrombospondin type-1 domain-containing protein 7A-like [Branchiostoma belcheri]|uniref:Thrombospondin type-1 domain-containing protein 7A-like n=1 Tax=Branchiostoma belcheri TaxID=7741 RepID=A0A6P4Z878_BRABE|nr:PREDICTED: thrombospondin type-1 domain-containing protein 7A-like [Branchiostoma belcheri]
MQYQSVFVLRRLQCLCLLVVLALETARGNQPSTDLPRDLSKYYWKTGPWGDCMGNSCGNGGVQTRTVWCEHAENWATSASDCNHLVQPLKQRSCFRVCKGHRHMFQWRTEDWGECRARDSDLKAVLRNVVECTSLGVQERNVTCIQRTTSSVMPDGICEQFFPKPQIEQSCEVPCPQDCVVSEFSDWSKCSTTCGEGTQTRVRNVLRPNLHGGRHCPDLMMMRVCTNVPPCREQRRHSYYIKVGPWTECREDSKQSKSARQVDKPTGDKSDLRVTTSYKDVSKSSEDEDKSEDMLDRPGVGYRVRQVRCMREDGQQVSLSYCYQGNVVDLPPTYESCVMPQDCQVSDWSPWEPCTLTCVSAGDRRTAGVRRRTRRVLGLPSGEGKLCPHLEEKEGCGHDQDLPICPRYRWIGGAWGKCRVDQVMTRQEWKMVNRSGCGGGVQHRRVFCVQTGDPEKTPVPSSLCGGLVPPSAQICTVPCPEPCLVSHWSTWSSCTPLSCNGTTGSRGFMTRTRSVLNSDPEKAVSCPPLSESLPCEVQSCYHWHVGEPSRCLLVDTTQSCGAGKMYRTIFCENIDGDDVDDEYCQVISPRPKNELDCHVPCPSDCVPGQWGPWSTCSKPCGSAGGRQTRTRNIIAHPGGDGKLCPPKPDLTESRPCNEWGCTKYSWMMGEWRDCKLQRGITYSPRNITGEGKICGFGVKSRKVWCMKEGGQQVADKRCPETLRPAERMDCAVDCDRDCLVTAFSRWTQCPDNCGSEITHQTRHRYILQLPTPGGKDCPDTLRERRLCENMQQCGAYKWKTYRWGDCHLPPYPGNENSRQECGRGIQTRALSCKDEKGESSVVWKCLQFAGPMPETARNCTLACGEDCSVSEWSKWSRCGEDCKGQTERKRKLTGRSRKQPECQDTSKYPLVETEPCPCQKSADYTPFPVGNWSDCILPDPEASGPLNVRARLKRKWKGECGDGVRYRAVQCFDHRGRLVSPYLCSKSGYIQESCTEVCPSDCRLSNWSPWTPCSQSCGTGKNTRQRWLRQKPFNLGRLCPLLDSSNMVTEWRACSRRCGEYQWETESWSSCSLYSLGSQSNCGDGVQTRKVKCVQVSRSWSQVVDISLCDEKTMPLGAKLCTLPCPGECVVGEWTSWTKCPEYCVPGHARERMRLVERPAEDGYGACPNRTEEEACQENRNCFRYHLNVSEWSPCQLPASAVCGPGVRTLLVQCYRGDGKLVDKDLCIQHGAVGPTVTEEACEVKCPLDCQLSPWSDWSACTTSCGADGMQFRQRDILTESAGQGRPCPPPDNLHQQRPCVAKPCFSWAYGLWSKCLLDGAECGHGRRVRDISCVQEDGTVVEDDLCVWKDGPNSDILSTAVILRERPCVVPCPGDCWVTEWSSWSSCHQSCVNGQPQGTSGIETRSRAILAQPSSGGNSCPSDVYETRTCTDGSCYLFEWKVGRWQGDERKVWCQRSDGVNVTGGCTDQSRPATRRLCIPECNQPHSFCKQGGICGCEEGYVEALSSDGLLDYCAKVMIGSNGRITLAPTKRVNSDVESSPNGRRGFSFVNEKGELHTWVYGAIAATSALIIVLVIVIGIACVRMKRRSQRENPHISAMNGSVKSGYSYKPNGPSSRSSRSSRSSTSSSGSFKPIANGKKTNGNHRKANGKVVIKDHHVHFSPSTVPKKSYIERYNADMDT